MCSSTQSVQAGAGPAQPLHEWGPHQQYGLEELLRRGADVGQACRERGALGGRLHARPGAAFTGRQPDTALMAQQEAALGSVRLQASGKPLQTRTDTPHVPHCQARHGPCLGRRAAGSVCRRCSAGSRAAASGMSPPPGGSPRACSSASTRTPRVAAASAPAPGGRAAGAPAAVTAPSATARAASSSWERPVARGGWRVCARGGGRWLCAHRLSQQSRSSVMPEQRRQGRSEANTVIEGPSQQRELLISLYTVVSSGCCAWTSRRTMIQAW